MRNNKVWDLYFAKVEQKQEHDSKNTARRQLPRTLKIMEATGLSDGQPKLLDLGCGRDNEKYKESLIEQGVNYFGCDPFNQKLEVNSKAIESCMDGQADIVVINNVLNTIKEKEVWKDILLQAHNAVNPETGRVLIVTYEGEKLSSEKKQELDTGVKMTRLTPTQTRDGWQNRFKTEEYLDAIREVFPNVRFENLSGDGGKVIAAAINPALSLELKQMAKNKSMMGLMAMSDEFGDKPKTEKPVEVIQSLVSQKPQVRNAPRPSM
ncbi:methyltransferase domain-containing protein [Vibrio coralliirubri]|uniref:methyltransferase domain-containing protein n=1 Tax=Vibrio coralliirubri TaxID=1516159 RepID=UPI0022847372|nr:methyltransferase domain-containing protein [Vibrio coralliirubri]MCY9861414.1 methyltransferase domain-containing protein [Vibrio coralliirubri]